MKKISTFFNKQKATNLIDYKQLDYDALPVLRFEELTHLLELQNKIREIRGLTSLDEAAFNNLYMPVLQNFIEAAQLVPASESYHHTVPGGLIIHTLNVICNSLFIRQGIILPLSSDPSIQAAERNIWTYAVFLGAILHDAGKLITQQKLKLDNGKLWTAHDGPIYQTGAKSYSIKFISNPRNYELHHQLSLSFFYWIPAPTRSWLMQYTHIVSELSGWLNYQANDWGSIGDIVRDADSKSVAESFGFLNATKFPGAQQSLIEKIITAIRLVVPSLVKNKPGAALFRRENSIYILSKTLIDEARNKLYQSGETSIPSDNIRIFDELMQFGYVQAKNKKAVMKIHVKSSSFEQVFSVLKFEANVLFTATNCPNEWDGELIELDESNVQIIKEISEVATNSKAEKSIQIAANLEKLPDETIKDIESGPKTKSDLDEDRKTEEVEEMFEIHSPEAITLESPELGHHFLNWLRYKIKIRDFEINANNSPVHKIENHKIGIVTPNIFTQYCSEFQLFSDEPNKKPFVKVQNEFIKLKLNIKFQKRDIHYFYIKGKPIRLNLILLDANDILTKSLLEINANETLEKRSIDE